MMKICITAQIYYIIICLSYAFIKKYIYQTVYTKELSTDYNIDKILQGYIELCIHVPIKVWKL